MLAHLIYANILRIEDDDALRAKVNEALNVYDDYLKTKGDGANGTGEEGSKEDATAEPAQA